MASSAVTVVTASSTTSRPIVSPRSKENGVETNHVADFHEDDAYGDHSNEKEYLIVPRTSLAPLVQQPPQSSPIPIDPFVQPQQCDPVNAASSAPPRNGDAHRFPHDDLEVLGILWLEFWKMVFHITRWL